MNAPEPQLVSELNDLAELRLTLQVQQDSVKARLEAAQAATREEFAAELQEIAEQIRSVNQQILAKVEAGKSTLIGKGMRSFVTLCAKFQLRTVPAKVEVLDKVGVMATARRLNVVRHVANPPSREWRFSQVKFLAWLKQKGKQQAQFEPFINRIDEGEVLFIQPNTGHTVWHDGNRISPPSVTITKS